MTDNIRFTPLAPLDAHNRSMEAHLHPRDWTNPAPRERYDLVVLGGGTAGLVTAAGAAGLGARVALVERELLGGDCLVTGCVPSKALIRSARAAQEARDGGRFGVSARNVEVDFPGIMERMRRERAAIAPHDSAQRFTELGVDVFLGEGRFTGEASLEVDGRTLRFKKACIATGSKAALPPIDGLDSAPFRTNASLFSSTELPRRFLVVGGGPIGSEMAQAFARFGSQVTQVEFGDRLLGKDHADAGAILLDRFRAEGIDVRLGSGVTRLERTADGVAVTITPRAEGAAPLVVTVDEVLLATGRAPTVEGLGLEAAGVEFDARRGILVDERLRTSNRRIFAAGDCASRFQFTHMADALARIVIRNALFLGRAKASDLVVPWATYTDPEVAATGLSLAAARDAGLDPVTTRIDLSDVDRANLDGETDGFLEVVHTKKGKVLGGTLVASHAGESISELTLAVQQGLTLSDLSNVIHPYPTVAEAFRKAGDAFNRTRLTPLTSKVLRWLARR